MKEAADRYEIANDPEKWNSFLHFMHAQIAELNSTFKPDLYWFDGDWEHSEKEWGADKIDSIIHTTNPNAILNGRLPTYGDYSTPEQNMPIAHPEKKSWELCLTSNDSWGFQPQDTNFKTTNEVLQIFTECLNMGGNLLLDIGPKADGTIPEQQAQLLKEIGRWTSKHSEAIYGTNAGLPYGHYHGNSTLSADRKTIYLFVNQVRPNGTEDDVTVDLMLKGIKNKIVSASVIGSRAEIETKIVGKISWSWVPGTVFIKIPGLLLDEEITVVKIILDSPLDLYEGKGGFH
jgi:alpha-L-fucosidase